MKMIRFTRSSPRCSIQHIVVIFTLLNITRCDTSWAQSSASFQTGQNADLMLSGIDFNNTGGNVLFNHPTGLASDGVRLFLCDRWNNRVLIWNSLPISNTPPDLVLGQQNFITNNPGVSKNQLNWPGNISVSANGIVALTDTYNDRILIWKSFPTRNGEAAEIELYLPSASSQGSPQRFEWPWGVWTDGNKLAVVATHGNSVLIWNSIPTIDNQKPDIILTNTDWGTPRNITSDGTYFCLSDHNSKATGGSATYFWKKFPDANSRAPDFIRKDWIKGCITSDGKLLAGGLSSIYIWNVFPNDSTKAPDLTLRPTIYRNGDGPDVVYAGGKMYVCNYNGNNILAWNSIPTNPNQAPDFAIGSPDINTNTLETNNIIQNPVIASNGKSLFVTSDFDRTLVVWKSLPDKNAAPPDYTIKLSEPAWQNALYKQTLTAAGRRTVLIWNSLPLNGESPSLTLRDNIGGAVFQDIGGVALDSNYFYIADGTAQKIWIWKGVPTSTSVKPFVELNMNRRIGRISSDGTYLCVNTTEMQDISVYRVADLIGGSMIPLKQLRGFPLNLPMHAITFDGKLAVANTVNNAVYIWNRIEDAGDYAKATILGENDRQDFKPEIGQNKLFWPGSLCYDGSHLWVGEFKFSTRILRFTPQQVSEVRSVKPITFTLEQNYPNPFHDLTSISYRLAARGYVRLEVFDLLGRRVSTLVNEEQEVGMHEVVVKIEAKKNEVLFYQIITPEFVETKKMVVMR